ncbi:MAG: hypothetical protein KGJ41_05175 [Rhodospirillales bacterium]|nr:hypothetical protein [Rhodospirillales bacterium]
MALAYLLLCHASAAHVGDLIRALHRPEDLFLVHADRKAPPALHALLDRLAGQSSNILPLPSEPCSWGGYSLVEATLRGIAFAAAGPRAFDHLLLLSEQHVPLAAPAEIAARLPAGESWVEGTPADRFVGGQFDDIAHRLAMRYRELPGVGGFATGPRGDLPPRMAGLFHGSQWMALSAEACRFLATPACRAGIAAEFGDTLLADETAIQSVLHRAAATAGPRLRPRSPTFSAFPDRGGTAEMILTDTALRQADLAGALFIRKRPPELPPRLAWRLDRMARLPAAAMPFADLPADRGHADVVALATAIGAALRPVFPDGWIEMTADATPRCLLRVHAPDLPAELGVAVLSDDLRAFKIVLAWLRPFDGSYAPMARAGYQTTILKIRAAGLSFAREVHALQSHDHGFVTLRPGEDLGRLVATIIAALRIAREMGGA